MPENTSVLEAESFKGAYLRFFLCGNAVHGRYHGKHGYKQEKHGKHRAHGLSFLGFTGRSGIGRSLILCENQLGLAERFVGAFYHFAFVKRGQNIYLRIVIYAERIFVQHGRYVCKAVKRIVGHNLRFVADADHLLTGFNKSFYFSRNIYALVAEGQLISDGNIVCRRKFVGQPDAVGTVFVVFVTGYEIHTRYPFVLCYR